MMSERRKSPWYSRFVPLLRRVSVVGRFPDYLRECMLKATSIGLSFSSWPTSLDIHLFETYIAISKQFFFYNVQKCEWISCNLILCDITIKQCYSQVNYFSLNVNIYLLTKSIGREYCFSLHLFSLFLSKKTNILQKILPLFFLYLRGKSN